MTVYKAWPCGVELGSTEKQFQLRVVRTGLKSRARTIRLMLSLSFFGGRRVISKEEKEIP